MNVLYSCRCRIVSIFAGIVPLLCLGSSVGDRLRPVNMSSGRYSQFRNDGEFVTYFLMADNVMGKFGPITVWIPEGTQEMIPISGSISGLNDALIEEARLDELRAFRTIIEYTKLYRGMEQSYFIDGKTRRSFLRQLESATALGVREKIEPLVQLPVSKIEGKNWFIEFSLVTWKGAVERRSYSGSFSPFSIRKEIVELVAPNGTIPEFEFKPNLD